MARGRMISATVATDKRLNSLSIQAELVYLKTIPHLDRDGLIMGDPLLLWAKVCPRRPELMAEINDAIHEWIEAELVISYASDEGAILFFTGFAKNQNGLRYDRESNSVLPPPPGYVRSNDGLIPQKNTPVRSNSGATPEQLRSNAVPSPAEVKVEVEVEVEVKGEVKGEAADAALPPDPSPQQEMFGAVCEAIGWDYRTLRKSDKSRVGETCAALLKAGYGIPEIRQFMTSIWFQDWRWKKEQQRPTLAQLQQEIGKIHAGVPETIPRNGTPYGGNAGPHKTTSAHETEKLRRRMENHE